MVSKDLVSYRRSSLKALPNVRSVLVVKACQLLVELLVLLVNVRDILAIVVLLATLPALS